LSLAKIPSAGTKGGSQRLKPEKVSGKLVAEMMKKLSDGSREMGWTWQTVLYDLSEHNVADGVFIGEHDGCIAKLYAARS
jgi:hypothetical protein